MDIQLAGGAITYEPDDDQLGGVSIQLAAFDGEVGVGQLPTPDPSAGIDVYDGRSCDVREIATLLTSGFIVDQERTRGPQPAGTARVHGLGIQDANALLGGFRVSRTRPSETDYARVMAFAAADHPTWITTWVLNTNTVVMASKTYDSDGGWTSELIPDLVEISGKTLWVHDLAYGGRCLHYHNFTSGHTCGLTVSDVPSAVDGVTVFAPGNPTRQRTSADMYNDVLLVDQTGRTSSATDATSISRHDADGMEHQAKLSVEASSQADLDVKAAAFLASSKDERDTYTCDIGPLDATALARIRVGDIMTVTSSVMGLTASPQRISHMTLGVWTGKDGLPAPGLWSASLELGAPVRRRARVANKATTDEPWTCIPTDFGLIWQSSGGGFGSCIASDPFDGCASDGSGGFGTVVHLYASANYRVDYTVFHNATSNALRGGIHPTTGPDTEYGGHDFGGNCTANPQVFASETISIGSTQDYRVTLSCQFFVSCPSDGSSIEARIYYIDGPDPRYEDLPACSNGAPRVGQRFVDDILGTDDGLGDGTTTDFTTSFPFQSQSLNIFCNGLDWTTDIASQTPGTGDFTMAYPFPLGSTVRVIARRAA